MKKLLMLMLCMLVFASLAMAQTYVQVAQPASRASISSVLTRTVDVVASVAMLRTAARAATAATPQPAAAPSMIPTRATLALWGEDLTPLYTKTLAFGDDGNYPITLPANTSCQRAA